MKELRRRRSGVRLRNTEYGSVRIRIFFCEALRRGKRRTTTTTTTSAKRFAASQKKTTTTNTTSAKRFAEEDYDFCEALRRRRLCKRRQGEKVLRASRFALRASRFALRASQKSTYRKRSDKFSLNNIYLILPLKEVELVQLVE